MNRGDYLHLLGEKAALERMLAETPEEDVLDRSSVAARLRMIAEKIARVGGEAREPARVLLTFRGRPVIGSHGVFVEFGMEAVNSFVEAVVAMAASLTGPLAAVGPIPNRDQHQLLITSTAVGSFGFQLGEHPPAQLSPGEPSAVALALDRTQRLLRGALGNDEELADSVAEADRRALEKVRGFLHTLVDHEAVCTVQLHGSVVAFSDVGQVRTSLERLSQENVREEHEELRGSYRECSQGHGPSSSSSKAPTRWFGARSGPRSPIPTRSMQSCIIQLVSRSWSRGSGPGALATCWSSRPNFSKARNEAAGLERQRRVDRDRRGYQFAWYMRSAR